MSRINSKENATRSREGSKEGSRKGSRGKSRERGREEGISWVKNGNLIPENIFKRSSTFSSVPQDTGLQSLNVRDAMVALRHAIRNPLSNQHEVTIRI